MVNAIAQASGVPVDRFGFPQSPIDGIAPRHVFVLVQMVYRNLASYYEQTQGYEPVVLESVGDLDGITPAEVFDLTQLIIGELKVLQGGSAELTPELASAYQAWKAAHESIMPGHVFTVVQHIFNASKLFAS